jgi:hypothetical protein
MTPTHTNKKGVRYPYYVSQAVPSVARKQMPLDELTIGFENRIGSGAVCLEMAANGIGHQGFRSGAGTRPIVFADFFRSSRRDPAAAKKNQPIMSWGQKAAYGRVDALCRESRPGLILIPQHPGRGSGHTWRRRRHRRDWAPGGARVS